jgi:hypothetical protein
VHAGVRISECSRERLEKLARYALRPPLVHDRLTLSKDGSHAVYAFRRSFRDGSTHVVLRLHEFLARLAALIPRPRAHLVTYHGVFAPAASARDRVVPELPPDHLVEKNRTHFSLPITKSVGRRSKPRSCPLCIRTTRSKCRRWDSVRATSGGGSRAGLGASAAGSAGRSTGTCGPTLPTSVWCNV